VAGFLARRLVGAVASLVAVSILIFLLIRAVPGDVIDASIGNNTGSWTASEEQLSALRDEFGLNDPLPAQYADWLGRVASGDLGTSWRTGRPIGDLLGPALVTSLELALLATIVSLLVGVGVGVLAALAHGRWLDYVLRVGAIVMLAVPVFWLGAMMILALSVNFGWIPPIAYSSLTEAPIEHLKIMALPTLALGLSFAASIVLFTRASMLDVLRRDYMVTAVSKGLSRWTIVTRHGLRNGLIPVVTAAGLQLGWLIGGIVVVEEVFAIPGVGRLLLTAITERDYPVVQAAVVLMALIFILLNLFVDALYARLDPRIRLGR
jgi:peptide/nickel transport system permease protein